MMAIFVGQSDTLMIRFLVNPAAGRGSGAARLDLLRRLAAEAGAELQVSESAEDLTARARRAASDGVDRLVVVGGDGTMHHAVQGLAGSSCALGLVSLGSGNDFASVLGIADDLSAAVEAAVSRPPRAMDLGRVSGPAGSRWFDMYCGVGFDSEVTRRANRVRLVRGPAIYPWAVIKTLFGFRAPAFRIEHDGGVIDEPGMFVTVANGPTYGGGMRIAPDARLDDGILDLVFVRKVSRVKLLRVFPKVYSGEHVHLPEVEILRTRRARIRLDREMEIYGDGEPLIPLDAAGVEVEVVSAALRVIPGDGLLLDDSSGGRA
jgi:diacylglycerol kinase (ATP)